jgi:iron-sulfur cluster repair protein YtfE (RIC family)
MLSEHDAVGDLLAKLRRLTDGFTPPADGCASYVACFAAMAELEAAKARLPALYEHWEEAVELNG